MAAKRRDTTAALEAIEARLHRACLTLECLPGDGPRGVYSLWPRYKLTFYDAEEAGSYRGDAVITSRFIRPPGFAPTPAEVDDCLPALALMDGLSNTHRLVVRLRAHQEWYGLHAGSEEDYAHWRGGWRAIGAMSGMHFTHAARLHWAAIVYAYEMQVRRDG